MILSVANWLGGADNIQAIKTFPGDQKLLQYNFNQDVTGWTFTSTSQTLVLDTIQWNKYTGDPNFQNSNVIGSFPEIPIIAPDAPIVVDPLLGIVKVTLPKDQYTGPLIPDMQKNIPCVVISLTWTNISDPVEINSQRWLLVMAWDPNVDVGDPTTEPDYTALEI